MKILKLLKSHKTEKIEKNFFEKFFINIFQHKKTNFSRLQRERNKKYLEFKKIIKIEEFQREI